VFGLWDWNNVIRTPVPQEQIDLTRDHTDYLLYNVNVTLSGAQAGATVNLHISNIEDYAIVQMQQQIGNGPLVFVRGVVVPSFSSDANVNTVTFAFDLQQGWQAGPAQLLFLTQTMGLQNFGPFLEKIRRGIQGDNSSVVQLDGVDLIHAPDGWSHQIGLQGEQRNYSALPSSDAVWQPTSRCAPRNDSLLVWYRAQLTLSLSADPEGVYAIDMASMGKGQLWCNGYALGRYWLIRAPADGCDSPCSYVGPYDENRCRTGCGDYSQRYYHVPRAWLRDGVNEITMLEEGAASPRPVQPELVTFVRRNVL